MGKKEGMGKKVWKTVASLVLIGMPLILATCSEKQEKSMEMDFSKETEMQEIATHVESTAEIDAEDPENPAGKLQNTHACSMVRVQSGNLIGSGVIIEADSLCLRVATAAHVLEKWDGAAKITFDDGFEVSADKLIKAEKQDLAILEIPRDALLEKDGMNVITDHGQVIKSATFDQQAYDNLENGDLVIALGSRTGVGEDAYAGVILQDYAYFADFDAYMILADVMVTPGMSGGGLFDAKGNLLGVICGISEEGEVAVAPAIGLLVME